MYRAFRYGFAVIAVVLMLSFAATADVIKLTGVGGNSQDGVYTVPYFLSVNGSVNLTAMCDDYTHDVVIGETWTGKIFSYADLGADLTSTRAGASIANGGLGLTLAQAQKDYKELFWLYSQFQSTPSAANDINFASWKIFDTTLAINAAANSWLTMAGANYNSVNVNNYEIISPADLKDGAGTNPLQGSSPQEYVTTPEPASLALLGSGLIGLGSFIRRKIA